MKPMIFDLKLPHWAFLLECPFCGGGAELFLMVMVSTPVVQQSNA